MSEINAIKYHLGCGGCYLPGYFNVDFPQDQHPVNTVHADLYADILKMSYMPAAEIRSKHFYEHFGYVDSMVLLYKWTNVLIDHGTLVIDLPDVAALAEALVHAERTHNIAKAYKVMRYLYGSHEADWAYHINGWSYTTLSHALTAFGYALSGAQKYGSAYDSQPNCGIEMTAVLSAKKPAAELKKIAIDILGLYRNGDSPFENSLWCLLIQRFLEGIK